jgi:hypothetical protein
MMNKPNSMNFVKLLTEVRAADDRRCWRTLRSRSCAAGLAQLGDQLLALGRIILA